MAEKIWERVEVSRIALVLLTGVPWITIIAFVFKIGTWTNDLEAKSFDSSIQKQEVIARVNDESIHWDYQKLDNRYVVKAELEIQLEQFSRNQEKIMRKLNIE